MQQNKKNEISTKLQSKYINYEILIKNKYGKRRKITRLKVFIEIK